MNTYLTQQQRQHAHGMIERLAPEKLSAVVGLLEILLDPLDRALANAEIDDEPITDEDRHRVREGRAWFAQCGGRGIPMEDVLSDFGLTLEDFPAGK